MTHEKVLFVCLHGAAKSVLAAADFERMAKERGLPIAAESAGTEPDPEIAPPVLAALEAEGVDMAGRKPRLVTRELAAGATRIVAFGCGLGEAAPDGDRIEQWEDVPAVSAGLPAARAVIGQHLERLLDRWSAA
jgi:arsenate reductase (thioredoxin)